MYIANHSARKHKEINGRKSFCKPESPRWKSKKPGSGITATVLHKMANHDKKARGTGHSLKKSQMCDIPC